MRVLTAALTTACLLFSPLAPTFAATCANNPPTWDAATDNSWGFASSVDLWRSTHGLPVIPYTTPETWSDPTNWQDRASSLGVPLSGQRWSFNGCRFEPPLERLKQRITDLGQDHPYIRLFVRNQNAVFARCSQDPSQPLLSRPDASYGPKIDRLIQADIEYQTAAAIYYQSGYWWNRTSPEAVAAMQRIVNQAKHPYRPEAAYMVALMTTNQAIDDAANLPQARKRIAAILQDQRMASVHRITRQLGDKLAYYTIEPALIQDQIDAIGDRIISAAPDGGYSQSVDDLRWFLPRSSSDTEDDIHHRAVRQTAQSNPAVDWLFSVAASQDLTTARTWLDLQDPALQTDTYKTMTTHALTQLDQGDPAWLVPIFGRLPADHPRAAEMLDRFADLHARRMSCGLTVREARIYPALINGAVRLTLQRGNAGRALALLQDQGDDLGGRYLETALTTVQTFLGLGDLPNARALLAVMKDGDHWRFSNVVALRRLTATTEAEALSLGDKGGLQETQAAIADLLPARELARIAANETVPMAVRVPFARVAYTRAYMLNDTDLAATTWSLIGRIDPDLADDVAWVEDAWLPSTEHQRRLLTILRTPRFNLRVNAEYNDFAYGGSPGDASTLDSWDANDNNWWCSRDPGRADRRLQNALWWESAGINPHWLTRRYAGPPEWLDRMEALTAPAREEILSAHPLGALIDLREMERLAFVPSGPRHLSTEVISWAEGTNWLGDALGLNEGVDDALGLAVRTTRWGCRWDGGHEEYSRRAFNLLHSRFPDSAAARTTPHWFDCPVENGCQRPSPP